MSIKTLSLTPQLYDYFLSISLRESPILKEIRQRGYSHPMGRMQIAPEQAQFLSFLLKSMGAKKVLEIGVFLGYSSTAMALALPPDGKLIACDNNPQFAEMARTNWQKAKVESKITLKLAPAINTLEELLQEGEGGTFDFVFIDADKENQEQYYEYSLQLVRKGGIIAVDNVLWYGRVAQPEVDDETTKKIREFNQKLLRDERIDLTVLPIGDGLTLALKR
ncbi:MAG: class I SAM-dependent methyltransferase [Geminocystis sp.]|nr:class I SAM-dependent methyltransferase [Geminocystis sp.]HIK37717.1 class I SAM-dependent methyltransferase [Geminocystis sp. M7585_C2015_104]